MWTSLQPSLRPHRRSASRCRADRRQQRGDLRANSGIELERLLAEVDALDATGVCPLELDIAATRVADFCQISSLIRETDRVSCPVSKLYRQEGIFRVEAAIGAPQPIPAPELTTYPVLGALRKARSDPARPQCRSPGRSGEQVESREATIGQPDAGFRARSTRCCRRTGGSTPGLGHRRAVADCGSFVPT